MGRVTIKHNNPARLAETALAAKLYVRGHDWTLRGDLERFRAYWDFIALAYSDGVPVGVCVILREGWISVYVRSKFRRKGIGSALVRDLKAYMVDCGFRHDVTAGEGVRGSRSFWKAVEIPMGY